MSWFNSGYYDKEKLQRDPKELLKDIEGLFYEKYTSNPPGLAQGYGIDETGGYPGGMQEQFSMVSMKSLVKAKQEYPERFFAVWHGGGVRKELVQYYRQGVDLLLLECYIWRGLPEDLGTEDIYQPIRNRLDLRLLQ